MNRPIQLAFNAAAQDKIIRMSDFKAEIKKLYRDNLTLGEKIYGVVVDKPLSVSVGVRLAVDMLRGVVPADAVKIGKGGEKYVSGNTFAMMEAYAKRASLRKSFDDKVWTLAVQAFDVCPDYKDNLKYKAARPAGRR